MTFYSDFTGDFAKSISRPSFWLYSTWVAFLIRYRKTSLGPVWEILKPAIFIIVLGRLFAAVSGARADIFIPHLAIGFVLWSIIQSSVSGSSQLFVRSRAQLMQGRVRHTDIILRSVADSFIGFMHQAVVIVVVLLVYPVEFSAQTLMFIPGILCFIAHSIWATTLFSILGARYKDVTELAIVTMRIAFLATPIIWMVGAEGGRGAIMSTYALFNPFYHAIEIVRAPLIGMHASGLVWSVNIVMLVVGFTLASIFYAKYRRLIAIWI